MLRDGLSDLDRRRANQGLIRTVDARPGNVWIGREGGVMDNASNESVEWSDIIASETPFDAEQGIWFKYGRTYLDRKRQLKEFENKIGFKLPKDFLGLIGEYCEGGFDGWYRVKKGPFGRIVWSHLLLMKSPDLVDQQMDSDPGKHGHTYITASLLKNEATTFYDGANLRYFPFGAASCFQSIDSCIEGHLAFDVKNERRVVFIAKEDPKLVPIADTFSEMMKEAVFEGFG